MTFGIQATFLRVSSTNFELTISKEKIEIMLIHVLDVIRGNVGRDITSRILGCMSVRIKN
jgi:hypothetical protein